MFIVKLWGSIFAPKNQSFYIDTKFLEKFYNKISSFIEDVFLLHWTWNFWHWFVNKYWISKKTYQKGRDVLNCLNSTIDWYLPNFKRYSARNVLNRNNFKKRGKFISWGDINPRNLKIISSDQLFVHLMNRLNVPEAFFLTDTDWIYDKNGDVLETIKLSEIENIGFREKDGDVTWGMFNKIQEISKCLSKNQKVWIINWYDLDNFGNILKGWKGRWTSIMR